MARTLLPILRHAVGEYETARADGMALGLVCAIASPYHAAQIRMTA
ncbi:hypothetical protein U1872_01410 [Sphingomonas sp. RB3P16]